MVTGKPVLRASGSDSGIKEKGIANSNFRNSWGSFGCLVRDKYFPEKKFLLTCYHVVNGDQTWNGTPINKSIVNYENKNISNNYTGYLNIHQDSALVEISEETIQFFKSIKNVRYPKDYREVSSGDLYSKEVFINGYSTTESSGVITHTHWSDTLPYGKDKCKIEDMIVISHITENGNISAISTIGDSGALVLDKDNNALGIVVAGDFLHTYAIKISTILNELGLELIS